MYPKNEEKLHGEAHRKHTLQVEVDGNIYSFEYHESLEPSADLVVLLPGLTDNSGDNLEGLVNCMSGFPANFISLQYEDPFSLEIYTEAIYRAIVLTEAKRVVCEGYCLGGAVLGHFLTEYSDRGSYDFEIAAAIFRAAIIDQSSFQGKLFKFLLRAQNDLPLRERILSRAFPVAARLYPRAELSGQAAAGLINYELVMGELTALPGRAELRLPSDVSIFYIGLDRDKVANNHLNIETLGLALNSDEVHILESSTTEISHHPASYEDLHRKQAELIKRGFGVG